MMRYGQASTSILAPVRGIGPDDVEAMLGVLPLSAVDPTYALTVTGYTTRLISV